MSITKRRVAISLAAVLVLAVIATVFSMTSIADETARNDYSVKFTEGGFVHADAFADYDKIFIIDVSNNQSSIDWDKVYADGIDGVMLRVGNTGYKYGTYNSDKSFETFYNGAKAAGLKVGAYYFGQPTSISDALTEANYALGLLNGRTLDLPVAYDLEYATNDSGLTGRLYESDFSSLTLTTIANTFCAKVAAAGYDAMVYTGCSMLTQNMIQSLLNYPVWIARYNSYVDYSCTYKMWQFTSKGTVDGISGRCDVSVLYVQKSAATAEESTTVPTQTVSGSTGDTDTTVTQTQTDTGSTGTTLTADTDTTVTESTTEETTQESDSFTAFLDFLLQLLEKIATYLPKIIELFVSAAA